MFRKSRIKIVVGMMSVLLLLFIGTLCVIYFSSYSKVSRENQEMLARYAEAYWKNGNPSEAGDTPEEPDAEDIPGDPEQGDIDDIRGERAYRLLSFHSVAFSEDREVISIDNDLSMGISDEALTELSEQLLQKKKNGGVFGSWVYLKETSQGTTLVVLMDNMITSGNISTLLQYTVLFGSITIVLLFLLSLSFARLIVKPLEISYQKQRQFISDAGHELKTPISVISANTELLEREFGPSKWLENVKMETLRMANLVGQLLELARTESAKPQMARVDFGRIVTGGVLPFESVAFEKNLRLETQIQEQVYVLGNEQQLGNLVSILTDNALEYAPEESSVTVSLKTERGRAILSVSNPGAEIPEEQRQHLFDRFYRADSSRGGDTPHYGLGLAIAKAVVSSHHGKIEVTCRGNQVTFTAAIPIIS